MNPNLLQDYIESSRTIISSVKTEFLISTSPYLRFRFTSILKAPITIREVSTGMTITLFNNQWTELLDGSFGVYVTIDPKDSNVKFEIHEYTNNHIINKIHERGNILTRYPNGSLQVAATYGAYTSQQEVELAGKPLSVRVGIPNLSASTLVVVGSFGFEASLGDLNSTQSKGNTVATWYPLTFSGASSGTCPARVTSDQPSYLWSDYIPCTALDRTDGREGSVIHIRLNQGVAAGDATWFTSGMYVATAAAEEVVEQKWRCYRSSSAVDTASSSQASFTTSANATSGIVPCIIQYVNLVPGQTFVGIGDSIIAGNQSSGLPPPAYNGYGYLSKARDLLSTAACPIELCNLGWSGQTMVNFSARYQYIAAELKNCILFHSMYTPNSVSQPMIATDIPNQKLYFAASLQKATENGCTFIYTTALPSNASVANGGIGGITSKLYGDGDTYRLAYNEELIASSRLTIDIASSVSGNTIVSGTAAGQQEYLSTVSDDGLHLNDNGNNIVARKIAKFLEDLI